MTEDNGFFRVWTRRQGRGVLTYEDWKRFEDTPAPTLAQRADAYIHLRVPRKTMPDKTRVHFDPSTQGVWGWHADQFRPWLTPVLGQGCLSIPSDDEAPVSLVREVVNAGSGSIGAEFLVELLESRLPEANQAHLHGEKHRIDPPGEPVAPLRDLWLPLANVCGLLAQALSTQLVHGPRLFDNWADQPIEINYLTRDAQLIQSFKDLIAELEGKEVPDTDRISRLRTAVDLRQSLDQAISVVQGLHDVLTDATADLDDGLAFVHALHLGLAALDAKWTECAESSEPEVRNDPGIAQVTATEIEWLTEVLWGSILVGATSYLTSEELQIRIQLHAITQEPPANPGHIRFPEVQELSNTETAQLLGSVLAPTSSRLYRRTADALAANPTTPARKFDFKAAAGTVATNGASDERTQFFDAVAALLVAQHLRHVDPGDPIDGTTGHTSPAIAFTLSFDHEIEAALLRQRSKFHIAFPVLVETSPAGRRPDAAIRWLCTLHEPPEFDDPEEVRTVLTNGAKAQWLDAFMTSTDEASLGEPVLQGPLIIKVNGAPLQHLADDLASVADRRAEKAGARRVPGGDSYVGRQSQSGQNQPTRILAHALPIDEYSSLQASFVEWAGMGAPGAYGMPQWLRNAIGRSQRYWLFLGLRLGDWSSRHRLFTLARRMLLSADTMPHSADATPDNKADRIIDQDRTRGLWGAAFMTKISQERHYLLDWLSISPVQAPCHGLTPDLLEYANDVSMGIRREFSEMPGGPGINYRATARLARYRDAPPMEREDARNEC